MVEIYKRSNLEGTDKSPYGQIKFRELCDYKSVGNGVQELRLDFGPGYRVYFAEQDDVIIILLCGGDKRTQGKDIKKAICFWQELKERSDE